MATPRISFEDFVDINNLMVKYQFLVDTGDQKGWSELFTEDGVFGGMGEDFVGRPALRKIAAAGGAFNGQLRHMPGALWIEYGDHTDEARARYYSLLTCWLPGQDPSLFQMAICNAHLVRRGGGWLVKSNMTRMLKPMTQAEVDGIKSIELADA